MTLETMGEPGLEELSREECLRLLHRQSVGRVAVTRHALPVILPVTYALDGEAVVFRTGQGTLLTAALNEAVVAFEVDDLDPVTAEGWSVVVTGTLRHLTEERELLRAHGLRLAAWAPGERNHFVRITPAFLSGRRLPLAAPAGQAHPAGRAD